MSDLRGKSNEEIYTLNVEEIYSGNNIVGYFYGFGTINGHPFGNLDPNIFKGITDINLLYAQNFWGTPFLYLFLENNIQDAIKISILNTDVYDILHLYSDGYYYVEDAKVGAYIIQQYNSGNTTIQLLIE